MTVKQFALPDLGEGLTESEVVEWHVAVGDRVTLNQTIADVETAKAVVQLPSPWAGIVTALHAEAGGTVEVGAPLLSIDVPAEAAAGAGAGAAAGAATEPEPGAAGAVADRVSAAADTATAPAAAPAGVPDAPSEQTGSAPAASAEAPVGASARTAVLVGYGPAVETGRRPARRPRTLPEPASPSTRLRDDLARPAGRGAALATPPVRKLAHDRGVDLAALVGTGEGGAVTRADVTAAAERARAEHPLAAPSPSADTRTPIRGVRRATAQAMVASAFTAPHVTEFLTVDVTATTELVARLRAAGHDASLLAVVAKALCLAVRRTPDVNSRWDEEAGEIIRFGRVGLGIAVATPRGLVVPCIPDAEALTVPQLAGAIRELATTAREGRTSPQAMRGGTITITNIGSLGVDGGTPILVPGEAAILATGAVRRQPWEFEGGIALREVMTLSLSFDHRLVDGEQAARFLTDIAGVLRDPASVLALV